VKPEFLDRLGAVVSAVTVAEEADGHLVHIAGSGHLAGVVDVALLEGPQYLLDVLVGFQVANEDPEAL
jgi:hypothetical protein